MKSSDVSIESPADPVDLNRAEVRISLKCVECGYNVRGLRAGSRCPECGHAVLDTVQRTIDEAESLPIFQSMPRAGEAIFIAMLAALVASVLILSGLLLEYVGTTLGNTRAYSGILVGGGALTAWVGVFRLVDLRPLKSDGVPHGLRASWHRVAWGFTGWAASVLIIGIIVAGTLGQALVEVEMLELMLLGIPSIPGLLALTGIGPLMSKLGTCSQRSAASRPARQSSAGLIGAMAILMLAVFAVAMQWAETGGWVVIRICQLMLLIGLTYLTVNAWWIRKALTGPPLTLRSILRTVE